MFFFDDNVPHSSTTTVFDNVKWQYTANKGEWSELYTLYKLLVDQNLFPISNEQNDAGRLRLPILSILRFTEENVAAEYLIDNNNIQINANGQTIINVQKTDFEKYSKELFEAIQRGAENAAFEITMLDEFRTKTCCPKIKCYTRNIARGVSDKSDLYIVIHDILTGQTPKLGFSIKSELGSAPTLLNATRLTNFVYKLSKNLPEETVNKINSIKYRNHADIQGRVRAIINAGANLDFHSINPNAKGEHIFYENLILIDSSMPEIIAHLLRLSYSEDCRNLNILTDKLTQENPLGFPMRVNKKCYEAKVKRFITDVALGMLPSQSWEATHQASGVLIVKESGAIDCYHVIYMASLEEYLYNDLRFETPSVSRHKFGVIETKEDGCQYFTLNLQLRFIH